MRKAPLAALGIATAISIPAISRAATFDFVETGATCDTPSQCSLPANQPFKLISLALPDALSSGTAFWDGTNSPAYTGTAFSITVAANHGFTVSSSFAGGPNCAAGGVICDFDITWSATQDALIAVAINIDAIHDDVGGLARAAGQPAFGLNGGAIASDGNLGGCESTRCLVSGSWRVDPVPEPRSLVTLLMSLALMWVIGGICGGVSRLHDPVAD